MNQNASRTAGQFSRRTFLSTTAKAAAVVGSSGLLPGPAAAGRSEAKPGTCPPIHIFSKHLQWLDYRGMAETAAEIGFDGVDLTVRPQGHVEPERVEDDLPRAVEAVNNAGLRVEMIVSSVRDPGDERTEAVLKTAGGLGIRYYRMGYHQYDKTRDIMPQLDELKPAFRDLAAMNAQYGLAATHQNHAGERYVGASLWDLHYLIRDIDPRWMGAQYDIRHAVVEGGTTWTVTLRLLSHFVNTVAIKDFLWAKGGKQWGTDNVPLGEGMVDFPRFVAMLKDLNIRVPVSLHLEYPIAGADKGAPRLSGDKGIVLQAMRNDLDFVRNLFAS